MTEFWDPAGVPREYVQLSNAIRRSWAPPLFESFTNGLASGNSVDEAALHGLYELVEQDCLADLSAIPRNEQTRLRPVRGHRSRLPVADRWADSRRQLVRDHRRGQPLRHPLLPRQHLVGVVPAADLGHGLPPRSGCLALNRALVEAAQSRLAIIAGTRESVPEQPYLLQRTRQERPDPLDSGLPVTRDLRPDESTDSIAADLLVVGRKVLAETSADPIVVDISWGHDGIAVTKTVVPPLRSGAESGTTEGTRPP